MIRPELLCSSWPKKPLREVVEFLDHLRRPITAKDRASGPYPYYGANGQQDSVADYIFDEPLILMAEDGGYFGDPDRTIAYRVNGKCWVNNHAHVLRPKDGVDISFLCYQLEKYDVTRFINGATRQKLNKGIASEIPITLPPIAEQKRIAAILDRAEAIRQKRKQAIKLADDFLRATFLDMFGDPGSNPMAWKSQKISNLLSDKANAIRTGPFGSQLRHSEFIEEGVPVIGIDNIVTNEFRWTTARCLPKKKYAKFKRYRIFPDDVIITIMGTTGKVAVAPKGLPECMSTKHLCVISLNQKVADPVFLWASLTYDQMVRNQAKIYGGGAIMEGWNTSIIKNLYIRIPPINLQRDFRAIVEKIFSHKKTYMNLIKRSDMLFKSISKMAFLGEL